jgi:hypothetical protein
MTMGKGPRNGPKSANQSPDLARFEYTYQRMLSGKRAIRNENKI